jgi:carboxylate-amine ligase
MADYSFGIEEEYFLADAATRGTRRRLPKRFLTACRKAFPNEVKQEMLQSQIEVASAPFDDFPAARARLAEMRHGLADIARAHGMLLLAASTHPMAVWAEQSITDAPRYEKLLNDLRMIGSRNIVCGMHVHVAVAAERRVDIMNRMIPFLPLLLALSTSSPFWQAHPTGLLGYRLAAYREMPRTGLPELFAGEAEYRRYVDTLTSAGAIENASFVWWALRPSLKHPTLELRIADMCTSLDDAIAVAALYRALVRHLDRNPTLNASMSGVSRGIAAENIWRAQRYGVRSSFVDEKTRQAKAIADVLEEAITIVAADARALGCEAQVAWARSIVSRGTSADRQLTLYRAGRDRGLDRKSALIEVVDWIARETLNFVVPGTGKGALQAAQEPPI